MSFFEALKENENTNASESFSNSKDYILNKMHIDVPEGIFKSFIKELFYPVSIKNQNGFLISNIFSITNILNVPLPIVLRLVRSIKNESDPYLILEEDFMKICTCLYCSTFEEKIDYFFKICAVSNSDNIFKSDIIILFKHLNHNDIENIMELIEDFFDNGKDYLPKKQYLSQVMKNSDLVFLFFFTITNNKLFNEDLINFYDNNLIENIIHQTSIRKNLTSKTLNSQLNFKKFQLKKVTLKQSYNDFKVFNSEMTLKDDDNPYANNNTSIKRTTKNNNTYCPSSKLLNILNKTFHFNFSYPSNKETADINNNNNINFDLEEFGNCDDLEELSLFENQVVDSLKQILQKKSDVKKKDNKEKENEKTNTLIPTKKQSIKLTPPRTTKKSCDDVVLSDIQPRKYLDEPNQGISSFFAEKSCSVVIGNMKTSQFDKNNKIKEFDKIELKKYGEVKLYLNGDFLFIVVCPEPSQNTVFNCSPKKKLPKVPKIILLKNICFAVNLNQNTIIFKPCSHKKLEFVFPKKSAFNKFIQKLDKINPNNYLRYQLDYEVLELLSQEEPLSFYSVKNKLSNKILKQKTISKVSCQEKEFQFEKYVLHYLKLYPHKNIVHIIDIYETLDNIIIIFELQQSKNSVIDVHKFLYDLIEGINYLHSNGILHRNISIENIINDSENNNFKVSNFSISRTFFPSETFKDDLPFGIYTSPEIIEGKIYNNSCDLWSYGIICYCLIEGKFPFQEENKDTMIMNINEFLSKVLGKVTEFWKNQNKLYEKILAKTLIKSIFSRPSSEEIIKLFNDCKITTNN